LARTGWLSLSEEEIPVTARDEVATVVLIVEDEPLVRLVVADALEEAGFTVLEAFDGDHAVRILEQNANRIRVIFSDINLPGSMNGVLLARHAAQHWPWIGVLLASGRPKPEDPAMPGNARFFQKPYSIREIVKHLRELAE
jgi:CheY-like chemotaxis protein